MADLVNNTGLSLGLAAWLADDEYDYNPDPYTISATTLLKHPKEVILSRRVPNSATVQDVWELAESSFGSAIHGSIEQVWLDPDKRKKALTRLGVPDKVQDRIVVNPTGPLKVGDIPVYMENRLSKQIGKWTVTGKYDLILEGQVQDYKILKTFAYTKGLSIDKFQMQGSIYRYLDPIKITGDDLVINMLFKDWSRGQLRLAQQQKKDYPLYPTISQRIPLLNIGETDRYVRDKLKILDRLMDAPESELPQCTDEDVWRTPSVFKYYKNPEKRTRSTANFPTLGEANARLRADSSVGVIVEVKGEVKYCPYCSAFPVCTQGQGYFSK